MPRGGLLRPCRAPGAAFAKATAVRRSFTRRRKPEIGRSDSSRASSVNAFELCRVSSDGSSRAAYVATRWLLDARASEGYERRSIPGMWSGGRDAACHQRRLVTSAERVSSSAVAATRAGPRLRAGPTDSCRSACRRRCPRFPCGQRRPSHSISRQGSAGSTRTDQVARPSSSRDSIRRSKRQAYGKHWRSG